MEAKGCWKSGFASIIDYSMVVWSIICFIGTWFFILEYGILLKGLFALGMTFFLAFVIWAIVLAVLILLSLLTTPSEEAAPSILFKDLIRRGMRQSSG
ncbi:MAG: hypothetical protein ACE144_06005 [Thermodesulfobacteriota bacterium]